MRCFENIGIYFLLTLFFISMGTASAADITVNNSTGPVADFTSIQAAVDAAEDGDTIIVYSGIYTEHVDVNKELTILSQSGNPEDTIVKAAVSDDHVFNVIEKNVKISGFTVTGATEYRDAGIYLNGVEGSIITNNIVSDNSCGIYLNSSSDNALTSNNTLTNNKASNNYYGIYLGNSSNNTLTSNIASGNKYGILLRDSSDNTLTSNIASGNRNGICLGNSSNNTLTSNKASDNDYYSIYLESSSGNTMTDNTASGNKYGIYLESSSGNTMTDNTASGNEYGILLRDSSDNTLIDNTMIDNTYNFGGGGINDIDTSNTVDGKPIYYLVNLSDITLDSTSNAGIVYCINCQNISIKDLNLENNEYGIYLYNTTGSNIDNNTASHNDHYGIYLWDSRDNTLTSNIASGNEGGIYLRDSSDNTLTSNIVSDNEYYGICLRSSDNTLTSNTASGNEHGIILYDSSDNTLTDNTMIDNMYNFGGGGINDIDTSNTVDGKPIYYFVNLSDITLDSTSNAGTVYCINCRDISIKDLNLENNEYGIFLYNTTGSNIDNNKVSDNYHGIFLLDSSNNNTLTSNIASGNDDCGIFLLDSSGNNTLTSNIASGNRNGIYLWDSSDNNTLTSNMVSQNEGFGIYLTRSMDNLIYNNYFNGVRNVYNDGNNIWNITKTPGTNIVGGPFLGGNYWSDYAGSDTDGDGLGDTLLPYNCEGKIANGGDYLPLVIPSGPIPPIPATVDINPGVLNLNNSGGWITAYIELPEGCDVNDIEVSTILLMESIPAESSPLRVGDYDADGILDLMVKFDKNELIPFLEPGDVELTVTGELIDGSVFKGTDTIQVNS